MPGPGSGRAEAGEGAPVRPVQLVEVDVVCAQALEAASDGCPDGSSIQGWRPPSNPGHLPRRACHLCGNHKVLPAVDEHADFTESTVTSSEGFSSAWCCRSIAGEWRVALAGGPACACRPATAL